jgi:uncharacterized membrane protein YoaK (UPF0700 family)
MLCRQKSKRMNSNQRNRWQGSCLAFLAGYVDTLGFVALFGLFTAHVTGNFIMIGAALADASHAQILLKFLAFPAFIFGVVAARLLIVEFEQRHGAALKYALMLQLLLLTSFMLFGWLASPIGNIVTLYAMVAGLFGAAAMGAHSATSRLLLAHLAPTSMMTGNVTQIVIDSVDVMRGAGDSGTRERCSKIFWSLLAFGVGAITAAFAYLPAGFLALIIPISILIYLIAVDQSADSKVAVAK